MPGAADRLRSSMTEALDRGHRKAPPSSPSASIRKSFGGVQALKGVSLDIARRRSARPGRRQRRRQVDPDPHPRRARRSPTAARSRSTASRSRSTTPHRATALGMSFIHQELALVPRHDRAARTSCWACRRRRASAWSTGAAIAARGRSRSPSASASPRRSTRRCRELSTAESWLVIICRALVRKARLIVMDEPTASLSVARGRAAVRHHPRPVGAPASRCSTSRTGSTRSSTSATASPCSATAARSHACDRARTDPPRLWSRRSSAARAGAEAGTAAHAATARDGR